MMKIEMKMEFLREMSFTFGYRSGPFAVLLASGNRRSIHHEAAMTVKLHHVAGFVDIAALNVAILRTSRRIAKHLFMQSNGIEGKRIEGSVRVDEKQISISSI